MKKIKISNTKEKLEKQIRKANKNLTFFVVTEENNPTVFLTITMIYEQALEYKYKLLKYDNLEHFEHWCEIKELDKDDPAVWANYYVDVLMQLNKDHLVINEISYSYADVTAILRMFGGCIPIGCSFDTTVEKTYIGSKLAEMFLNQAEESETDLEKENGVQ